MRKRRRELFNAPSELDCGALTPENFPLQNNGYTRVIVFSLRSFPREKYTGAKENEEQRARRLCRIRNWRGRQRGNAALICICSTSELRVSFRSVPKLRLETTKHNPDPKPARYLFPGGIIFPIRAIALSCDRSWNRRSARSAAIKLSAAYVWSLTRMHLTEECNHDTSREN